MRSKIDQAVVRPVQYWFDDGLTEIIIGAYFVLIAVLCIAEYSTPRGSALKTLAGLASVLVVVGGAWIASRVLRVLKVRFVFPRTGYVKYHRPQRSKQRRWVSSMVGAIISVTLGIAMTTLRPPTFSLPPVVEGLALALAMTYIAHFTGLYRFYALAVVSIVLGLVIAFSTPESLVGISYYFGAMGLTLLLLGLVFFVTYLRSSQAGEIQ